LDDIEIEDIYIRAKKAGKRVKDRNIEDLNLLSAFCEGVDIKSIHSQNHTFIS
jgi:hypothetical protein